MRAVGIIGLGLIGGSMAKAIKKHTDCTVFGYDASSEVMEQALKSHAIDAYLTDNYDKIDMLLVALYPLDVVDIILDAAQKLNKGCIVTDCTGVKKIVCDVLSERLSEMGIRFIGGHPMAGKEVSGFTNACDDLYDGASMILCRDRFTDEKALNEACDFYRRIGFARVTITTAQEHDKVIAYTSQLAHVVSSAYIKSPTLDKRYGFSAGSFRDMTRVAKLNEEMWADLFLANDAALTDEIDEIAEHLMEFRNAIAERDRDEIVSLLREGRIRKEADSDKEEACKDK